MTAVSRKARRSSSLTSHTVELRTQVTTFSTPNHITIGLNDSRLSIVFVRPWGLCDFLTRNPDPASFRHASSLEPNWICMEKASPLASTYTNTKDLVFNL